jgi:hypothetical protein
VENFSILGPSNRPSAQGSNLEETRKKVTLDGFGKCLAGDNSIRRSGFRSAFMKPAGDQAYQEATGKMKLETED